MVLVVAALLLIVVAWRLPDVIAPLIASPRLAFLPASIRASPLRFAAASAAALVVVAALVSGGSNQALADEPPAVSEQATPGQSVHEVETPPPSARTPSPMASPSPDPTVVPTPPPTASPTPAFGLAPTGPVEGATVASVTDGDTIRVILNGQNVPVRYIGIDTPETQNGVEPIGREASEANSRLVAGGDVWLETDVSETDRYGRLLRNVWVETDTGWLFVNLELVRLGLATVVTFPPDVKYHDALLLPAQREAREAGLGIWGLPVATPTPPGILPLVPQGNCEPSYPDFCLAIGTADLDCADVEWRRFTVLWNVANPDPHRFDGNSDGVGCES
jgi:micrococcal nuclease